jgi:hypothetical protein
MPPPPPPPRSLPAEHDPSLVADSPAGSVASSALSRATAAGGGRGGGAVERLLYKALRALTDTVSFGPAGGGGLGPVISLPCSLPAAKERPSLSSLFTLRLLGSCGVAPPARPQAAAPPCLTAAEAAAAPGQP